MKTCLIRCPSPFLINERVFPPLGLMAIGTSLKLHGHDVYIHDDSIDTIPMDFDCYGLGPTTPEYGYALDIKQSIRQNNPEARIVIGGPYATLNPQTCIEDGFDCVVTGDGEPVLKEAFCGSANILNGGENNSLDEYPTIDRSVIDLSRYKYFLNDRIATTVMTSQGCPYKCAFCCKTYKTVRFRSVDNVIKEIRKLHFDFGYNAITFTEDLFILKKDRVEAFCDCLKSLGIIWRCLVRADVAVKHGSSFVRTMANSGCVSVGMGIESGSNKILSIVNKGETAETIKRAIRMFKDVGIKVKGFFILGLPGESSKTIEETEAFLDEMQLDDVDIKIYQPYPGTPIWDNKKSYDIQWHNNTNYKDMFYKGRPEEYYGNVYTSSLTANEIVEKWTDMESTYKTVWA